MFLNVVRFVKLLGTDVSSLSVTRSLIPAANEVIKRNAGHSQWANRKNTRESANAKKSMMIRKFQYDIHKEINFSKNPNIATNTRLQAILGEAKKASIPSSVLEKTIKAASANLDCGNIHYLCYSHYMGINCVLDLSAANLISAKANASSVFKKFGFQFREQDEISGMYKTVGLIISKPLKTDGNVLDKALEDAINANCEEVTEADGTLEFQCCPKSISICSKNLANLGYQIEFSDTMHVFEKLIDVQEEVHNSLNKLQEKLEGLPGFTKVTFNVNNR